MINNNMPGFTAPASIYPSNGRYQTIGGGTSQLNSAVVPHLPIGGGGTTIGGGGTTIGGGGVAFSCEGRCNIVQAACTASCALLGPLGAAICVAACTEAGSDCRQDCGGYSGIGGGGGGVIAA